MSRAVDYAGLDLIKRFEGCRLTAYKCPGGVWTIGYGHTSGVKSGQKITQTQADAYLKKDLQKFESIVNVEVKVSINQNQFDALVSFTYNVGGGAFRKSTLLKKLNTGNYQGAAEEFLKWNKAGGKVLPGLTNRRKAEKSLFLLGESQSVGWIKDSAGWWYREAGGRYPVSCWRLIDGLWYHFDGNGYMQTGWMEHKNTWYYLRTDGSMASGCWIGSYYVTSDGSMAVHCYVKSISGNMYYWVNENGVWEPQWNTKTPDLKKYKCVV